MVDILSWDKSIDEDVKTSDDKKVGKVRAVTTNNFIQIEKGTLTEKRDELCAEILHSGNTMETTSGWH